MASVCARTAADGHGSNSSKVGRVRNAYEGCGSVRCCSRRSPPPFCRFLGNTRRGGGRRAAAKSQAACVACPVVPVCGRPCDSRGAARLVVLSLGIPTAVRDRRGRSRLAKATGERLWLARNRLSLGASVRRTDVRRTEKIFRGGIIFRRHGPKNDSRRGRGIPQVSGAVRVPRRDCRLPRRD